MRNLVPDFFMNIKLINAKNLVAILIYRMKLKGLVKFKDNI